MIIFIDESGDAGFKIAKGSSRNFVVVLIIFEDELDAEETALAIKKLRRNLKKSDNFEFKFNKMDKKTRLEFLNTVKKCKFKIRAIVIQKEKIYSRALRESKDKFYNFVMKEVLKNNNDTIKNAKIRLDGLGERTFRRNLSVYLRKNLNDKNKSIIKDLKFRNSKNDVLIQLADVIAGTISKSYDAEKSDSKEYIKTITKLIDDLWEFK
jgi:hypothetical protein